MNSRTCLVILEQASNDDDLINKKFNSFEKLTLAYIARNNKWHTTSRTTITYKLRIHLKVQFYFTHRNVIAVICDFEYNSEAINTQSQFQTQIRFPYSRLHLINWGLITHCHSIKRHQYMNTSARTLRTNYTK